MTVADNVVGAFNQADAAKLSGLSEGQLKTWDRSRFFVPSYAAENRRSPYSRVYSFRDLVSLRVLGQLRNKYRVSLQHLKQVSKTLSHLGDTVWTSTTLYVLGKRVVFDDPRTNQRAEVVSGQRVFDIPLEVAASDTKAAIKELNVRSASDLGRVLAVPFTQNDQVFKGTRIPFSAIVHYVTAGFSEEQIISEFPDITSADIAVARDMLRRGAA